MKLIVTQEALTCFKQEWEFADGEQIRIFVRYVSGGETPFAFGITRDQPIDAATIVSYGQLTFYMESKDVWFLEGSSLVIDREDENIIFRLA